MPLSDAGCAPGRRRHRVYSDAPRQRYLIFSEVPTAGGGSSIAVADVEGATGGMSFGGTLGVDLFATWEEAEEGVDLSRAHLVSSADALIGATVTGSEMLLLEGRDITRSAVVPPGHEVFSIGSLRWVRLPLTPTCARPAIESEVCAVAALMNLPLKRTSLIFSPTCDLSRPFPYTPQASEHDPVFVWNLELRQPFEALGLGSACVVLIRGVAEQTCLDPPAGGGAPSADPPPAAQQGVSDVSGGSSTPLAPHAMCVVTRMATGSAVNGPHRNAAHDTAPPGEVFRQGSSGSAAAAAAASGSPPPPVGQTFTTEGFECPPPSPPSPRSPAESRTSGGNAGQQQQPPLLPATSAGVGVAAAALGQQVPPAAAAAAASAPTPARCAKASVLRFTPTQLRRLDSPLLHYFLQRGPSEEPPFAASASTAAGGGAANSPPHPAVTDLLRQRRVAEILSTSGTPGEVEVELITWDTTTATTASPAAEGGVEEDLPRAVPRQDSLAWGTFVCRVGPPVAAGSLPEGGGVQPAQPVENTTLINAVSSASFNRKALSAAQPPLPPTHPTPQPQPQEQGAAAPTPTAQQHPGPGVPPHQRGVERAPQQQEMRQRQPQPPPGGAPAALAAAMAGLERHTVPVRDCSHEPVGRGGAGGAGLSVPGETLATPSMRFWRGFAQRHGVGAELFCIGVAAEPPAAKGATSTTTSTAAAPPPPPSAAHPSPAHSSSSRGAAAGGRVLLGALSPPTPPLSSAERRGHSALDSFVQGMNRKVGHRAASLRAVALPQQLPCDIVEAAGAGSILQRRGGESRATLNCPTLDPLLELIRAALAQDGAFTTGEMQGGGATSGGHRTILSRQRVVLRISSLAAPPVDLAQELLAQIASPPGGAIPPQQPLPASGGPLSSGNQPFASGGSTGGMPGGTLQQTSQTALPGGSPGVEALSLPRGQQQHAFDPLGDAGAGGCDSFTSAGCSAPRVCIGGARGGGGGGEGPAGGGGNPQFTTWVAGFEGRAAAAQSRVGPVLLLLILQAAPLLRAAHPSGGSPAQSSPRVALPLKPPPPGGALQALLFGLPRQAVLGLCHALLEHHLSVTADQAALLLGGSQHPSSSARVRSKTLGAGGGDAPTRQRILSLATLCRIGALSVQGVEASLEGLVRLVCFALSKAGGGAEACGPALPALIRIHPAIQADLDPQKEVDALAVTASHGSDLAQNNTAPSHQAGVGGGSGGPQSSPRRVAGSQPSPYDVGGVLQYPLSYVFARPAEVTEQPVLLSTLPGTVLAYKVPSAVQTLETDEEVLLAPPSPQGKGPVWITSPATPSVPAGGEAAPGQALASVKLTIVLPRYCRVSEIHFTRRCAGQGTDLLAPAACDVLMGQHVDDCMPVFRALRIPIAADGTCLRYTVPSHISGNVSSNGPAPIRSLSEEIVSRFNSGASPHRLVRVVHVIFHPLSVKAPMILGPVHIYGFPTQPISPKSLLSATPVDAQWKSPLEEVSPQGALELLYRQLSTVSGSLATSVVTSDSRVSPQAGCDMRAPDTPLHASVKRVPSGGASRGDAQGQAQAHRDPNEGTFGRTRGGGVVEVGRFSNEEASRLGGISFASDSPTYNEAKDPLECYEGVVRDAVKRGMDMSKALHVECHRHALGIPPEIRDVVLLKMGSTLAGLNPAKHIFTRDPKVEAKQRKHLMTTTCNLCSQSQRFTFWSTSKPRSCEYCRGTFCKDCMARDKVPLVEFGWASTLHEVCKTCGDDVQRQLAALYYIRDMTSATAPSSSSTLPGGGADMPAPAQPPAAAAAGAGGTSQANLTRSFAANPVVGPNLIPNTSFNPSDTVAAEAPKVLLELAAGRRCGRDRSTFERMGHTELMYRALFRDSLTRERAQVAQRVLRGGGGGCAGEVGHLSDLPRAALLLAVPTHPHSIPAEAVLCRGVRGQLAGSRGMFDAVEGRGAEEVALLRSAPPPLLPLAQGTPFFAPSSCREVTLHIKLAVAARVTSVVFTADCYGHTEQDALTVEVSTGHSLNALTPLGSTFSVGVLPPGARREISLFTPPSRDAAAEARIVALTFRLAARGGGSGAPVQEGGGGGGGVADCPVAGSLFIRKRVHLGTLAVQGVPVGPGGAGEVVMSPARKVGSRALPEAKELLAAHTEDIRRVVLPKEKEEWFPRTPGHHPWVLDITLGRVGMSQALMGFSVQYQEADALVHAQARDVRVTHLRGSDVQSHIPAGDFILPTAPPQTPSYFLFPIQFTDVKQVRLEIISLHGPCSQPARPLVELFTSATRVHTSEAFPSVSDAAPEALSRTVSEYCAAFRKNALL